jgi:phosphatidylethanolamine/phosphatidyl-N-methylethanolamine N-methyltransferase
MNTSDLDRSVVETAYARWAPIYDAVCVGGGDGEGPPRGCRAIGGKILEVGVGTSHRAVTGLW